MGSRVVPSGIVTLPFSSGVKTMVSSLRPPSLLSLYQPEKTLPSGADRTGVVSTDSSVRKKSSTRVVPLLSMKVSRTLPTGLVTSSLVMP